jgi:4-hydroxyphenylacetate decarboxylase large subunit
MNLKIHPSAIRGREGGRKLLELIRGYMRKGGFHIQFNVVDTRMLRDAQGHPENYRDLLVRVAGFTHYWVELPKPIQDEIIARTEYEELM